MRKIININKDWLFSKEGTTAPKELPSGWESVDLPHTWNGEDGQDGGGDYYRGRALYVKEITKSSLPPEDKYYLEIKAANSRADVYIDGEHIGSHDGGYSSFVLDISDRLGERSILAIAVDNGEYAEIYPQFADFTFYGGLYRGVNIIALPASHFAVEPHGTRGVKITTEIDGDDACVLACADISNPTAGDSVSFTVTDREGKRVARVDGCDGEAKMKIEGAHLWDGLESPYLYTLTAELCSPAGVKDRVVQRFGCRSFSVDPERGFILNGREYPLRGVSRHQDRPGIGNALLPEHHREDIGLILELGANTVRLAHYQHDEYFYELCDEAGLVVWAEIPYISRHEPRARENSIMQMKELIVQNYNHPSIFFWGLSNEITMKGGADEDLLENHRILNELCHKLDPCRKTAVAAVSPCDINHPYLGIPDLVAYNHYFGWYGGDVSQNGAWFDNFHAAHPNIPIGCSEYGCEALDFHTSSPEAGDYTEEYQAYYHEQLIKQLFSRKYLFATYVWNMFDFGADARCEGGENGKNHKGLVTFDRKYKKDSFYAYKAHLSREPFVHIAGKRYAERAEDVTRVTVYSNLDEVELFVNGESLGKKRSEDRFFKVDVRLSGEVRLEARAGECRDNCVLRRVEKFNEKYRLKESHAVLNWYDISAPEGYFSLNDKVADIIKTDGGRHLFNKICEKIPTDASVEMSESMLSMLGGFSLIRLLGMMGMMGYQPTKEELLSLNRELNLIPKNS